MGYELQPHGDAHRAHFLPTGTDLSLCSGRRHVRVLILPYFCGERSLREEWKMIFRGHNEEDVVVWLPWDNES